MPINLSVSLAEVPLFASASEEQLKALARSSEITKLTARDTICDQVPSEEQCYLVLVGRVKISYGPIFIHMVKAGEMFGTEHFLFAGSPLSAECLEGCTLVAISSTAVREFLKVSPEACLVLLRQDHVMQDRILQRLSEIASMSVSQRLVRFLLHLAEIYGIPRGDGAMILDLGLTHQDIASSIGTSREMATTLLNQLKCEGYIGIGRRTLTILSEGLQHQLVAGDHHEIERPPHPPQVEVATPVTASARH